MGHMHPRPRAWRVGLAHWLLALAALAVALRLGAGERLASCELDADLLASLRNELAQWRHSGIDVQHMRDLSKVCPEWQDDLVLHCAAKYERMTIDNNEVFMTSLAPRPAGQGYPPPYLTVTGVLLELYETAQKYKLPNVDLTFAFGDREPWFALGSGPESVQRRATPILTFFKGRESVSAIRVPDSGRYRCELDGVDVLLAKQSALLADPPWDRRNATPFAHDTLFCTTCHPKVIMEDGSELPACVRTHLQSLSHQKPELFDYSSEPRPLIDFRKNRYVVSSDGFSATAKYEKMYTMGSLVLKSRSACFGWFYDTMKPYKHYVPLFVKHLADIFDVVKWLREHDKEAEAIAKAGTERASKILSKEARMCFWKTLIDEIASLQTYRPSCRLHKMCVPLKKELDFHGVYELCPALNIHQAVDEIHGEKLDHGPGIEHWGAAWGSFENASHGYPGWFMHEDDVELLPNETIRDWKPPAWAAKWTPLDLQI